MYVIVLLQDKLSEHNAFQTSRQPEVSQMRQVRVRRRRARCRRTQVAQDVLQVR